jgi:nucleotide-binding universal stress UspA family protein
MSRRRRSYEAGHRAKLLLVADGSPEFDRALTFAARRASRFNLALVALAVVTPPEAQVWAGVGDIMRQEAEEVARLLLDGVAERARAVGGPTIEKAVRSGKLAEEIVRLIDEDEDIVGLILGAGTSAEGPGPLVTLLAGKAAATFPVPVTIVPGSLSDAELSALG